MSIYGSTFSAGDPVDPESVGVVLIRDGGTNHWPTPEINRIGSVDGAWIPSWCVPGHQDEDDEPGYEGPGPWYRLSGCSWRHVDGFDGFRLWSDQEYLLDEDAAKALRDDLTRWLDAPKTRPTGA